uniref:Granzyme B(G,H) n=1 Tax=Maylandia zebra TaxID=106582 RepID=A0A3P9B9X9_9CICH
MSFNTHIKQICKTAFFHLRSISKIRNILSQSDAEKLVHAFITSRLDYCNSLLSGCPKTSLKSLQLIQNAAARVLTGTRKREHISPVLASLHWLPHGSDIINGEKAPENSSHYMASVQNKKGQHVCGGFLITEDFVVSAAHCDEYNPTDVVLGNHNLKNDNHQKIKIKNKNIRENYQNIGQGNDIMLLEVSTCSCVQLNERVQTIQLPPAEIHLEENQVCQVAGWGKTKTRGKSVDELRVVDVSVINQRVCEEQWPGLPANVICAGGYKTTKGFCQGDSGGPLLCDGLAVGVVSFNYKENCSYPNKPNIYTDISKYRQWIDGIVKSRKYEE